MVNAPEITGGCGTFRGGRAAALVCAIFAAVVARQYSRLARAARRFRRQQPERRRLIVRAMLAVAAARLGVRLLSLPTLERIACRSPRRHASSAADPADIAWAVGIACRALPRSTCLVAALAGQSLLSRAGHRSAIQIGVVRKHGEAFAAHAWVEVDGERLIGGDGAEVYSALTPARL